MTKKCSICDNYDSKYKCPKCEIPYCSVDCFKQHKDSIECTTQSELKESESKDSEHPSTLLFTTMDTVPLEDLEKMRHSEPLKNLLYNPHLRKLLKELDSSRNPHRAINAAMMEPLFQEFADECLKLLEPENETQDVL